MCAVNLFLKSSFASREWVCAVLNCALIETIQLFQLSTYSRQPNYQNLHCDPWKNIQWKWRSVLLETALCTGHCPYSFSHHKSCRIATKSNDGVSSVINTAKGGFVTWLQHYVTPNPLLIWCGEQKWAWAWCPLSFYTETPGKISVSSVVLFSGPDFIIPNLFTRRCWKMTGEDSLWVGVDGNSHPT